MITGARLIAPEGYLSLSNSGHYYFLVNDAEHNRARLIEFHEQSGKIIPLLITLTTFEFEEGLEAGSIQDTGLLDKYPPWLEKIQGVEISHLENRRRSIKETYDNKVNRRFLAIAELVQKIPEVLASDNPDAFINAHAKVQMPKQNAARLRLWFYTYLIFGRNKWALMPGLHRIGGWNRYGPGHTRKLGRPSPRGKRAGYRCDLEMQSKIKEGYLEFRSAYKTKNDIYGEILKQKFGCIAIEKGGTIEFRHPKGHPFPSITQMRDWIKKRVDEETHSVDVRGKQKTRAMFADRGSFSERLRNVNQSVELDGYNISEKLSGLTEGSAVDSFCVVRAVCVLSGAVVGIGFSEGKENMAAYRMCLFSMALDKVKFCELFGCEIRKDHWPCEGLSGGIIFDRGPGATMPTEPEIHWLGTFETTPTFSGQSKASVESSHPRDKKTLDQPTYVHSGLNFVQMARREIFQVLDDNLSSRSEARIDERMALAGVRPNPISVWNYWSGRGRNSSIGMQFETAVRNFLSVKPVKVRQDGVYLYSRKYRSAALVATGVFDRVAKGGVINTTAYVLTMCVRHIWIEVDGLLYELDMVRTQRTIEGDIDISLWDLQEIDRIRRESLSLHLDARPAIKEYVHAMYKDQTGADWSEGKRKLGRPPKSSASELDDADYARQTGKHK
ncbi:transposase [Pseudomonas putida]